MKIEVNGNDYDIEILGNKAKVNGENIDVTLNEEEILINGKKFHLDFIEEGEPSLMIINGMTYLVSKSAVGSISVRELKAPISGLIIDVLVTAGSEVNKDQPLVILEAMKMENQIKSPLKGRIREIRVDKGQSVKTGDVLVTFE
jgi:biotin carboxyl carrier protein